MKTNNFSLAQLLCTSILSALVGMIMVFTALTVKPHNEIAAATNKISELVKLASIKPVATISFDLPTVAKVEVIQDVTQSEAQPTTEPTTEAAKVVKSASNNVDIDKEIEAAKAYCLAHMVHPTPVDLPTTEPEMILAAK